MRPLQICSIRVYRPSPEAAGLLGPPSCPNNPVKPCLHLGVMFVKQCISNVSSNAAVVQLLRSADDIPMNGKPLWERSDLDDTQLVTEFQRDCQVVRRGIDGDLVKVCTDWSCMYTVNVLLLLESNGRVTCQEAVFNQTVRAP